MIINSIYRNISQKQSFWKAVFEYLLFQPHYVPKKLLEGLER